MTTVAELPAGFVDKVLSAQSTFRSVISKSTAISARSYPVTRGLYAVVAA